MNPFNTDKVNPHLMSLVFSLAQAAMVQLGKISNPGTGQVAKDLDAAKMSIDLLLMLRDKTKGNLTPEEEKIITGTLTDLELNYADEASKGEPPPAAAPAVEETKPKDQKIFPGK